MIRERFWNLCSKAEEAYSNPDIEPALDEILRLVESSPEARPELARCFIDLAREPARGPWEVVEFCMHRLRWPEVREAIEADLKGATAAQDWRTIQVLHHILAAYGPEWDGADLYQTFRQAPDDPGS